MQLPSEILKNQSGFDKDFGEKYDEQLKRVNCFLRPERFLVKKSNVESTKQEEFL
jgi:hypothetical protein